MSHHPANNCYLLSDSDMEVDIAREETAEAPAPAAIPDHEMRDDDALSDVSSLPEVDSDQDAAENPVNVDVAPIVHPGLPVITLPFTFKPTHVDDPLRPIFPEYPDAFKAYGMDKDAGFREFMDSIGRLAAHPPPMPEGTTPARSAALATSLSELPRGRAELLTTLAIDKQQGEISRGLRHTRWMVDRLLENPVLQTLAKSQNVDLIIPSRSTARQPPVPPEPTPAQATTAGSALSSRNKGSGAKRNSSTQDGTTSKTQSSHKKKYARPEDRPGFMVQEMAAGRELRLAQTAHQSAPSTRVQSRPTGPSTRTNASEPSSSARNVLSTARAPRRGNAAPGPSNTRQRRYPDIVYFGSSNDDDEADIE